MNDRLTATLFNPQQAHPVIQQAWMHAKAMLFAGHRLTLEIKPEKRNLAQNARLHARLTEIAAKHEWAGRKRDTEVWKRLLTAAWLRARGESVEILPAIDGHGVDVVFRRTSDLTKTPDKTVSPPGWQRRPARKKPGGFRIPDSLNLIPRKALTRPSPPAPSW